MLVGGGFGSKASYPIGPLPVKTYPPGGLIKLGFNTQPGYKHHGYRPPEAVDDLLAAVARQDTPDA
jgi:hypothetical protein